MGNIVTVEANAILTSSVTGSTYTHAVTPVNLALTTTNGDATTKGTEVTGGSYARQTTASSWGTASGGSITNSALAISFTNMPSCTIVGIELWDSATRTNSSADGNTTNGSPNISSATASFTAADVGQPITGTGIPGGTTILTFTDSTHVVLSANATATNSTTTFTITTPVRRWFGSMTSKVVNSGDTVTFATSSISITLS
jgi:hypothetical protein